MLEHRNPLEVKPLRFVTLGLVRTLEVRHLPLKRHHLGSGVLVWE